MRIELLNEDTTLADLSTRIHGKKLKKQPALAERLAALNPHVAALATIPKGTPILVPEDDEPSAEPRLAAATARAQSSLDAAATLRLERLEEQSAALDERLTLIRSARPGLAGNKELARLDEIEKTTRNSVNKLKKEKEQVTTQLDVLLKSAVESVPSGQPFGTK